jgi:hypothetical protein
MQNSRTDSLRVLAVSDDFARSAPHPYGMFLLVTRGGGAAGLAKSLDNPSFFRSGTHSGI